MTHAAKPSRIWFSASSLTRAPTGSSATHRSASRRTAPCAPRASRTSAATPPARTPTRTTTPSGQVPVLLVDGARRRLYAICAASRPSRGPSAASGARARVARLALGRARRHRAQRLPRRGALGGRSQLEPRARGVLPQAPWFVGALIAPRIRARVSGAWSRAMSGAPAPDAAGPLPHDARPPGGARAASGLLGRRRASIRRHRPLRAAPLAPDSAHGVAVARHHATPDASRVARPRRCRHPRASARARLARRSPPRPSRIGGHGIAHRSRFTTSRSPASTWRRRSASTRTCSGGRCATPSRGRRRRGTRRRISWWRSSCRGACFSTSSRSTASGGRRRTVCRKTFATSRSGCRRALMSRRCGGAWRARRSRSGWRRTRRTPSMSTRPIRTASCSRSSRPRTGGPGARPIGDASQRVLEAWLARERSCAFGPARPEEARALTHLALRSKAHWGYDKAFMRLARAAMEISPELIARSVTYVAERGRERVGFYMLVEESEGPTLQELWIEPAAIGAGFGWKLWLRTCSSPRVGRGFASCGW